jgi:hypothetical protein
MIEYAIRYAVPNYSNNYIAFYRKITFFNRLFDCGWKFLGGASDINTAYGHIKADRKARKLTMKLARKLVRKIKV